MNLANTFYSSDLRKKIQTPQEKKPTFSRLKLETPINWLRLRAYAK